MARLFAFAIVFLAVVCIFAEAQSPSAAPATAPSAHEKISPAPVSSSPVSFPSSAPTASVEESPASSPSEGPSSAVSPSEGPSSAEGPSDDISEGPSSDSSKGPSPGPSAISGTPADHSGASRIVFGSAVVVAALFAVAAF